MIKYFSRLNWSIWLVGVVVAFLVIFRAGLAGIIIAIYILPLLLFFALLNLIYDKRRGTKDPAQPIKDYNIVDFCLLILLAIFGIATLLGIVYILFRIL